MADKWNVKICQEHLDQFKSPLEKKVNGQGRMSQLGQKLKQAASQIRIPRQES